MSKLLFFLLALGVFACGQSNQRIFDGTVTISGQLTNVPDGKIVLAAIQDERAENIAEIEVGANGKFEYQLSLDGPGFYVLNMMDRKEVRLALYDQDVEIVHDFADDDSLEIKGSDDSIYLQQVQGLMNEYQAVINMLNDEYFEAMSSRDQEKIREIQVNAMGLEEEYGEKMKSLVGTMDGSFAALGALSMVNPKKDFIFMDELVTELSEKYPDFQTVQNLKLRMDEMRALSVGQEAPEISLPDPDGNLVNLSDLRGNYVLIDFWAAWCRPCREENPNVVRLYNQYNDRGFEVFGVSLDRTHDAWVKAIADDELTWTHVSDLKYFNSEAAAIYQINAIPATYLLDPEGKIIAKDLRGPSLENKLKELFN
ncbi:TlpA disulfide reductase family protein [Cecembia sp.]|uniref:TlpA disulfide reductase family protein n=1 Tax=Cecembia sp. TaxID=1898110 RepID=UPI0025C43147|nr:TlpA disulfide reductase family protein [Cecembia sp.]